MSLLFHPHPPLYYGRSFVYFPITCFDIYFFFKLSFEILFDYGNIHSSLVYSSICFYKLHSRVTTTTVKTQIHSTSHVPFFQYCYITVVLLIYIQAFNTRLKTPRAGIGLEFSLPPTATAKPDNKCMLFINQLTNQYIALSYRMHHFAHCVYKKHVG